MFVFLFASEKPPVVNPYAGNETAAPTTAAQADAQNIVGRENRAKIGRSDYGGRSYAQLEEANAEAAKATAAAQDASERSRQLSMESANYRSGRAAYSARYFDENRSEMEKERYKTYSSPAAQMAEEAARRGDIIDPYVAEKAAKAGWIGAVQTIRKEDARQTVPVRDYSSGVSSPVLVTPGTTHYVPYGDRAQTEIRNSKAVISPGGEISLYQLRPERPGFTPRYGHIVSGGGLNAAQSGMFTEGRAGTPVVYTQESAGTKFAPGVDAARANAVLANPKLYSRSGAELYGGDVVLLDNRKIVASTGVDPRTGQQVTVTNTPVSTYPAEKRNLAQYVEPFAVNRPKNEIVGNAPWDIDFAGAPKTQMVDVRGNLTPAGMPKAEYKVFGGSAGTEGVAMNFDTYYTARREAFERDVAAYEKGGATDANEYYRLKKESGVITALGQAAAGRDLILQQAANQKAMETPPKENYPAQTVYQANPDYVRGTGVGAAIAANPMLRPLAGAFTFFTSPGQQVTQTYDGWEPTPGQPGSWTPKVASTTAVVMPSAFAKTQPARVEGTVDVADVPGLNLVFLPVRAAGVNTKLSVESEPGRAISYGSGFIYTGADSIVGFVLPGASIAPESLAIKTGAKGETYHKYGMWDIYAKKTGDIAKEKMGLTDEKMQTYWDTQLKNKPGAEGHVERLVFGAGEFITDKPLNVLPLTATGATMAGAGEVIGASRAGMAAQAMSPRNQRLLKLGGAAWVGGTTTYGLTEGFTDFDTANIERRGGASIIPMGAMMVGATAPSAVPTMARSSLIYEKTPAGSWRIAGKLGDMPMGETAGFMVEKQGGTYRAYAANRANYIRRFDAQGTAIPGGEYTAFEKGYIYRPGGRVPRGGVSGGGQPPGGRPPGGTTPLIPESPRLLTDATGGGTAGRVAPTEPLGGVPKEAYTAPSNVIDLRVETKGSAISAKPIKEVALPSLSKEAVYEPSLKGTPAGRTVASADAMSLEVSAPPKMPGGKLKMSQPLGMEETSLARSTAGAEVAAAGMMTFDVGEPLTMRSMSMEPTTMGTESSMMGMESGRAAEPASPLFDPSDVIVIPPELMPTEHPPSIIDDSGYVAPETPRFDIQDPDVAAHLAQYAKEHPYTPPPVTEETPLAPFGMESLGMGESGFGLLGGEEAGAGAGIGRLIPEVYKPKTGIMPSEFTGGKTKIGGTITKMPWDTTSEGEIILPANANPHAVRMQTMNNLIRNKRVGKPGDSARYFRQISFEWMAARNAYAAEKGVGSQFAQVFPFEVLPEGGLVPSLPKIEIGAGGKRFGIVNARVNRPAMLPPGLEIPRLPAGGRTITMEPAVSRPHMGAPRLPGMRNVPRLGTGTPDFGGMMDTSGWQRVNPFNERGVIELPSAGRISPQEYSEVFAPLIRESRMQGFETVYAIKDGKVIGKASASPQRPTSVSVPSSQRQAFLDADTTFHHHFLADEASHSVSDWATSGIYGNKRAVVATKNSISVVAGAGEQPIPALSRGWLNQMRKEAESTAIGRTRAGQEPLYGISAHNDGSLMFNQKISYLSKSIFNREPRVSEETTYAHDTMMGIEPTMGLPKDAIRPSPNPDLLPFSDDIADSVIITRPPTLGAKKGSGGIISVQDYAARGRAQPTPNAKAVFGIDGVVQTGFINSIHHAGIKDVYIKGQNEVTASVGSLRDFRSIENYNLESEHATLGLDKFMGGKRTTGVADSARGWMGWGIRGGDELVLTARNKNTMELTGGLGGEYPRAGRETHVTVFGTTYNKIGVGDAIFDTLEGIATKEGASGIHLTPSQFARDDWYVAKRGFPRTGRFTLPASKFHDTFVEGHPTLAPGAPKYRVTAAVPGYKGTVRQAVLMGEPVELVFEDDMAPLESRQPDWMRAEDERPYWEREGYYPEMSRMEHIEAPYRRPYKEPVVLDIRTEADLTRAEVPVATRPSESRVEALYTFGKAIEEQAKKGESKLVPAGVKIPKNKPVIREHIGNAIIGDNLVQKLQRQQEKQALALNQEQERALANKQKGGQLTRPRQKTESLLGTKVISGSNLANRVGSRAITVPGSRTTTIAGTKTGTISVTKPVTKTITRPVTVTPPRTITLVGTGVTPVTRPVTRPVTPTITPTRPVVPGGGGAVPPIGGGAPPVIPPFPGGFGGGGEGTNWKNLYAFREHSATITPGEMARSLFTGRFTQRREPRQPQRKPQVYGTAKGSFQTRSGTVKVIPLRGTTRKGRNKGR